jgi:hypothetical protein
MFPLPLPDQSIPLLNLGKNGKQTVFDAAMPSGSYSDIQLDMNGHDFLATVVTVSGSQMQAAGFRTKLGSFTIFDLTRQRLGRSTVLHLAAIGFPISAFSDCRPNHAAERDGTFCDGSAGKPAEICDGGETATSTLERRVTRSYNSRARAH